MQREGWDCAEAVELHRWPKVLLTYREECGLNNMNDLDTPLPILLNPIIHLRHDAVHRNRLSSSILLQRMTEAGLVARLLQDDQCTKLISTVRMKTQDAIEGLVRNKQLLEEKVTKIREDFAAKRAELERQETALLEAAVREHEQPVVSVSGSLGRVSGDLGGTDAIHTPWRHECDPVLLDNEPSGSEGFAETHIITSATESCAELAVPKALDTAEEKKKDAEAAKKAEADAAEKKRLEDEEMERMIAEMEEEVKKHKEDKKRYAEEKKKTAKAEKNLGKDKDLLVVESYPTQPNLELERHESDPKQHPISSPWDSMTATDHGDKTPETAAAMEWENSQLLEHHEKLLRELSTAPACTGEETTEDDADPSHDESLTQQVASLEAEIRQSDSDSVLKALTEAMANKKRKRDDSAVGAAENLPIHSRGASVKLTALSCTGTE